MILSKNLPVMIDPYPENFMQSLADQVQHLTDTHEDAHSRGHHHEEGEYFLLSGSGNVAVHRVGARLEAALGQPGHIVAMIDAVEDVEEACVQAGLEDEAEQVGPPQAATLLPWVGVEVCAVGVGLGVLEVLLFAELDMRHHHE